MSSQRTKRTPIAEPQYADVVCRERYKLLARYDERGVYLYCKECDEPHILSWEQVTDMYLMASHHKKSNVRI